MASVLGKRKGRHGTKIAREPLPARSTSSNNDNDEHLDAFRRAFEAKFKPLEGSGKPTAAEHMIAELEAGDYSTDSDWEGFGSAVEEPAKNIVEVFEPSIAYKPERLSNAEAKAFMNSKPPDTTPKTQRNKLTSHDDDDDDDTNEKLNLKNDLALQRLINESHLLDKAKDDGTVFGRREKRLDLRIQALGAKSSILKEQKMPMSHRKGIVAKAKEREDRRRREARESGIILERTANSKKSSSEKKRLRGVGGPSIGKFKDGTLKLSKRDVAEIRRPARGGRKINRTVKF